VNTIALWIYGLTVRLLPESRCFALKRAMLRMAGAKIGANVRIYSSVRIIGQGSLEIGDDVHIGPETLLYPVAPAGIRIGSHVDVAPRATILTGSHVRNRGECEHVAGEGTAEPVEIGDGSWICAGSVILPGVTLPKRTLVAAGAVVTKSIDAEGSMLAGVPAKTSVHSMIPAADVV